MTVVEAVITKRSVAVLGIDETRRGRPKWAQAEDGTWTLVRDRWHVGFTDITGGQGLGRPRAAPRPR